MKDQELAAGERRKAAARCLRGSPRLTDARPGSLDALAVYPARAFVSEWVGQDH